MKRASVFLALLLGLGMPGAGLRSQDAEPEAAPVAVAPVVPIDPIPNGTALQRLRAIRDANAKLIEQQVATLQKLEEMEKLSQTLKTLGKRS